MEQKRKTVVIVSDTRINGVFVDCGPVPPVQVPSELLSWAG